MSTEEEREFQKEFIMTDRDSKAEFQKHYDERKDKEAKYFIIFFGIFMLIAIVLFM